MMDANRFILIIAICATCFASGCVEKIDTPVKAPRKIVVNCLLTKDSIQTMTLTYSTRLGDLMYDKVEDADARLYANDKEVGQFIRKGISNEWTLKYTPVFNTEYRLEVKTGQSQMAWATTTFPKPISIARTADLDNESIKTFKTLLSTGVFWVFAFHMKDMILTDPRKKPVTIDPEDDKISYLGTTFPNVDNFNLTQYNSGEMDWGPDKYNTYIRMLPNDTTSFALYDIPMGKVVVRTPSDEYDKYLKTSLTKMMRFMKEDDPTTWLDETIVFNNINNGVGIFGAYYDLVLYCDLFGPEFQQYYIWH